MIVLPVWYWKLSLILGGLTGDVEGPVVGTSDGVGDGLPVGVELMFDGLREGAFEGLAVGDIGLRRVGTAVCEGIWEGAVLVGPQVEGLKLFVGTTDGAGVFFVGMKVGAFLGNLVGDKVGLVVDIAVGAIDCCTILLC